MIIACDAVKLVIGSADIDDIADNRRDLLDRVCRVREFINSKSRIRVVVFSLYGDDLIITVGACNTELELFTLLELASVDDLVDRDAAVSLRLLVIIRNIYGVECACNNVDL